MKEFDPYKILGLSPEADLDEIRRAFRAKARRYHPDVGGKVDLFLTLKQSYDELCRRYTTCNRLRIVKKIPKTGNYFLSFLELSVQELALGATVVARVPDKPITCPRCKGKGVDPLGRSEVCPICEGQGIISNGKYKDRCPRCMGEGRLLLDLCPSCRGKGELITEKEMRLIIPQGARPDDILYLPASSDGPGVDVYFEIQLHSHSELYFDGDQLVSKARLPFWKAILGGKVKIRTLEGQEILDIPPGFQPDTVMVLPNRGAYKTDGSRGELLVRFEIYFPTNLNQEAKELLEKLAQILEKEENYGTSG